MYDAQQVISVLNNTVEDLSYFGSVISDCKILTKNLVECSFVFVNRSANQVTHILIRVTDFLSDQGFGGLIHPFFLLMYWKMMIINKIFYLIVKKKNDISYTKLIQNGLIIHKWGINHLILTLTVDSYLSSVWITKNMESVQMGDFWNILIDALLKQIQDAYLNFISYLFYLNFSSKYYFKKV